MVICEGGTLEEKLEASENGLDESLVKKWFQSLLSALHYCLKVH